MLKTNHNERKVVETAFYDRFYKPMVTKLPLKSVVFVFLMYEVTRTKLFYKTKY